MYLKSNEVANCLTWTYLMTLHMTSPNSQDSNTSCMTVNGKTISKTMKSAKAKLKINVLVMVRIRRSLQMTKHTRKLPNKPTKKMTPKSNINSTSYHLGTKYLWILSWKSAIFTQTPEWGFTYSHDAKVPLKRESNWLNKSVIFSISLLVPFS